MTPEKISETSKGVYIIAATPFTDEGELDLESTDRLTDFYLERGVTGFTILGMMGEAPKLTEAETLSVMDRVLRRVARWKREKPAASWPLKKSGLGDPLG